MFTPKTALILILIAFLVGFAFYIAYPTPEKYDSPQPIPQGAVMEDGVIE